jgi:centromeric protein E
MASNGHLSSMSARSSMAASTVGGTSLNRTASVGSASTVGQLPRGDRLSGSLEDEDSLGEFGDGTASLHAQVRALQADLADKTRYCQTLEKRLLQARRSSHSRTSVNFSKGGGIMVGEDHGVAALLKDKDAEIAELRARLDDKDRMLDALRSAARSRDTADRDPRAPKVEAEPAAAAAAAAAAARPSLPLEAGVATEGATASPVASLLATKARARRRSVDEMSRMLDEMIQDRVERGDMVRGARGSVRLASERRQASLGHSATTPRPMPLSHEAPS